MVDHCSMNSILYALFLSRSSEPKECHRKPIYTRHPTRHIPDQYGIWKERILFYLRIKNGQLIIIFCVVKQGQLLLTLIQLAVFRRVEE